MRNRFVVSCSLAFLSLALSGCPADDPGYQPDTDDDPPDTASSCKPRLDDLSFVGSFLETEDGYDYSTPTIIVYATYALACDAIIVDSSILVHVSNVDALNLAAEQGVDPPAGAERVYEFPITEKNVSEDDEYEGAVHVKESEKQISIVTFITNDDLTTTFNFELQLIDSNGRYSSRVDDNVVYQEVAEDTGEE